jgi:hypothetical protein
MAGKDDRAITPHKDMYITKVTTTEGKNKFLEYVLTNYEQMQSKDITPMFVFKSLNTGETSVVLDAQSTDALSLFVKKNIRSRDEVTAVKVDNMVRPVFFPLPENLRDKKRFAVTIECQPMMCKGIYKQMIELGSNDTAVITMVTFIMNEVGQYVSMSVIANDLGALNAFIDGHLSTMPGVDNIRVSELAHLRKLSTKFEWKKTVQPIAEWESLIGRDYDDRVYRDVDQGC